MGDTRVGSRGTIAAPPTALPPAYAPTAVPQRSGNFANAEAPATSGITAASPRTAAIDPPGPCRETRTFPVLERSAFPARTPGASDADFQARLHESGDAIEAAFLSAHGPGLASFSAFAASRDPVVLVHGIDDAPADMLALAERFAAQGRQVLFFCYDDRHTPLADSGAALATALRTLRAASPTAAHLDIVAHSMGGIVTRAAFVALAQGDSEAARRAGFPTIDFTTLDTPWAGASPGMPALLGHAFHEEAWVDMDQASDLLRHLHTLPLPGHVALRHVPALQDPPDRHLWLSDLAPAELLFVARALARRDVEGTAFARAPGPHASGQLQHLVDTLREDARWPTLRERLATMELNDLAQAPAVLQAIHAVIVPIHATHTELLYRSDALDTIAALVAHE